MSTKELVEVTCDMCGDTKTLSPSTVGPHPWRREVYVRVKDGDGFTTLKREEIDLCDGCLSNATVIDIYDPGPGLPLEGMRWHEPNNHEIELALVGYRDEVLRVQEQYDDNELDYDGYWHELDRLLGSYARAMRVEGGE